jgi:hypothetical protein
MSRISRILLPLFVILVLTIPLANAQPTDCSNFANGNTVQASAPWYCSQINVALTNYWLKWFPVALLAVFVSFSIASIIFGIGTLLRNERIRNFGVGEYYEALASALIVCMFLIVSGIMFGLIPGVVTGPVNPYVTALNYISQTINGLQKELTLLLNILAIDAFYISIKLSICSTTITCTAIQNLFAYTIQILFYAPGFALVDLQQDVLALLYAEFWMIVTFMYLAIPVFLIPGVVLRSLIPTRGLGGMMIAMAIGFYLVMPLLFSIAYYFTSASILQQLSYNTANLQRFGGGTGAEVNAETPSSPLVQTLDSIQAGMDSYWLSVLFYPSLIMALTYAIILQIADFIGGMAQLSGKLRV